MSSNPSGTPSSGLRKPGTGIPRPGMGIPRPQTKLPQFNKPAAPQPPPPQQQQTPASATPRKTPDVLTPGRPSSTIPSSRPTPASGLPGKRSSIVPPSALAAKRSSVIPSPGPASISTSAGTSVPRPRPVSSLPSAKPAPIATTTAASKRDSGISHISRASTSTTSSRSSIARPGSRSSIVRPASRTTQQRLASVSSIKAPRKVAPSQIQEDHDQLGSLDSFSASRRGSQDDDVLSADHSESNSTTSSRPSLSERAMESISKLPATPKDRRRSSFFSPMDSPVGSMPPPLRPASSMSRTGSNGSRPGTSDGNISRPSSRMQSPSRRLPASARPATRTTYGLGPPASKRNPSTASSARLRDDELSQPSTPRAQSPTRSINAPTEPENDPVKPESTVAAVRPKKSRPSLRPSLPALKNDGEVLDVSQKRVPSNSSTALREQIAAAKAAAKKEREKTKHDSPQSATPTTTQSNFAFDAHMDPFNQAPKDEKHILRNRIKAARTDGKLNISGMKFKEIPEEVMNMYSSEAIQESGASWMEVVDLTRLVAADNEIATLNDDVFPDRSLEDLAADENSKGNQFAGLELLDLHGNAFTKIPIGFRRLERLTTLNLARNKLDDSALEVISQMSSLKDLKLGHNDLAGHLPASLCQLQKLEKLDLQENRLLGLPDALRELVSLRMLNVSGNQLTALPMEAIQQLSLVELDASKNALIGSIFPLGAVSAHSTLQILSVANNSLAAIAFSEAVDLPALRSLDVSNNHLTGLPPVNMWTEMHTLIAGDNKITELPQGFTALRNMRTANFTSNEIRLIDPEIAKMDNLESFILAANPLREKKFLTMSAADIKRDMRSRLAPDDSSVGEDEIWADALETNSRPGSTSNGPPGWALRPNGSLDLGSKSLTDEMNDTLGGFLERTPVRELFLQSNNLSMIPLGMTMGQDLRVIDLSNNSLSPDYLTQALQLPSLKELSLSRCRLSSLEPLCTHMMAPNLQSLNVTINRLAGPLPKLRDAFPTLTTLWAGDNRFTSITAAALRGMATVNLSSNDIEQLPAEVGLLWDEGLRNFEIGSNAFRVPNYRVLEKGTEATLRWLRARIPAAEGSGEAGVDELD